MSFNPNAERKQPRCPFCEGEDRQFSEAELCEYHSQEYLNIDDIIKERYGL